jgi:hypothetical protein
MEQTQTLSYQEIRPSRTISLKAVRDEPLHKTVIRAIVATTASAIADLSNDLASTDTGLEAAAAGVALEVGHALLGYDLGPSETSGLNSLASGDRSSLNGLRTDSFLGNLIVLGSLDILRLLVVVLGRNSDLLDGSIVGLVVAETASTVAALRNELASADARLESTAPGVALEVGHTLLGDSLGPGESGGLDGLGRRDGAGLDRGTLGGCERDVVEAGAERSRLVDTSSLLVGATARNADLEAESRRDVAVRRSTAATTSAGAVGLGDGRAGALAGREAAASLLALAVAGALDEDDLLGVLAGRDSSGCSRSSRCGGCGGCSRSPSPTLTSLRVVDARSGDLAAEGDGGNVVGGDVAEPTSTVTLLGNDGGGTLAGLEATARGGAVGVRSTDTSDELGAGTGKDERGGGESDCQCEIS